MLQAVDKFHKTKSGYVIFGLVELALSYLCASFAVNSGSLWEWFLALIFLIGFLQNLVRLLLTISKWRRAMH